MMTHLGENVVFSIDYIDLERVIFDGAHLVGEGVMCAMRYCEFRGRSATDMRTIIAAGGAPSLTHCIFS